MKNTFLLLLFIIAGVISSSGQTTTFFHKATSKNSRKAGTQLSHSSLKSGQNSILFVAHNAVANSATLDANLGVWFFNKKWFIVRMDKKAMPVNAKFNVLVKRKSTSKNSNAFTHKAVTASIKKNATIIKHPLVNGNPKAKLIVTSNIGSSSIYNNHPIGVFYADGYWHISNQDQAPMTPNALFNILVDEASTFTHLTKTLPKQLESRTPIKETKSQSHKLFITPHYVNVYNPHFTGIKKMGTTWSIFNEDKKAIPQKALFNILDITESKVTAIVDPVSAKTKIKRPCSDYPRGKDLDGDGYVDVNCGGTDCDDENASIYPDNYETCDDVDNDCDLSTFGEDKDGDGFVDANCCNFNKRLNSLICGTDCDDTKIGINPGMIEIPGNKYDENCDGIIE